MLQFITHYTKNIGYLDSVKIALEGGCRWVQLRMKHATVDEIRPVALEAQRLCREAGATFVIDDHVGLVREIGADGVHLGKTDMPIDEARHILGTNYIIGGTANTFDDVVMHWRNGADYIGCGPFRFTTTKEKLSPVLGLEGYRSIVSQMKEANIPLPIVAIGGINAARARELRAAGPCNGVAVVSAICGAPDPAAAAREIVTALT